MKETEIQERTIREETVVKIKCDGCGNESYTTVDRIWNDEGDTYDEVCVWANLNVETYAYDVCPECFMQKIKPLFDGKGVKHRLEKLVDILEERHKDADAGAINANADCITATTMEESARAREQEAVFTGKRRAYGDILNLIEQIV